MVELVEAAFGQNILGTFTKENEKKKRNISTW